jgi:hypothetical protein
LRRSRSSRKNPPAERRLKKATPKSQASTSQGSASIEGAMGDRVNEELCVAPLAASLSLAVDWAAASADDFTVFVTPERCCE